MPPSPHSESSLEQQIRSRFGLLPNSFRCSPEAPESAQQLWAYAQAAYLDNPLPSLFKERLFAYLSRFIATRYCLLRHTGFLLGKGHIAGDPQVAAQNLSEVVSLLGYAPPGPIEVQTAQKTALALPATLSSLPSVSGPAELTIFHLVAGLFFDMAGSEQSRDALRHAIGTRNMELVFGLTGFIRAEHAWVKLHSEIVPDDDLEALLMEHHELGDLLATGPLLARGQINQELYGELQSLRRDKQHRAELLQAKKELEERDKQKDKFIAMLGHELRNPVAAISAVSEMFQMVNATDNRLRNAGNILHRQTQALGRMLDDLLDVSTFAFGKVFVTKSPLAIDELLGGVLRDFEPQLKASGLTLKVDLNSASAHVLADRTRLSQAIENILTNALQFTSAPGTISVTSRVERKQVVVTVSDSGTGFDPAFADTILEPFAQAPQDLGRKRGGLGLGLAIAKLIADLHDGVLEASSAGIGKGATLKLSLPLSSKATGETSGKVAPSSRIRVLVVEDNRDFAQLFRDMLQIMGCDPEVGTTAQAGLEIAQKSIPDMIFCDIGLPGDMDGFGFARAVRADDRLAHIPLIAVSGYTSSGDKQRAIDAGFDRVCPKPVKFGDISEALKSFSEKNASTR
jgi:signal transduction histidine kinase/CheY-like chemotaxis protein